MFRLGDSVSLREPGSGRRRRARHSRGPPGAVERKGPPRVTAVEGRDQLKLTVGVGGSISETERPRTVQRSRAVPGDSTPWLTPRLRACGRLARPARVGGRRRGEASPPRGSFYPRSERVPICQCNLSSAVPTPN